MLTAKQEKFVQELIKGKSQREAYKEAFNCKNMKDETIDKLDDLSNRTNRSRNDVINLLLESAIDLVQIDEA